MEGTFGAHIGAHMTNLFKTRGPGAPRRAQARSAWGVPGRSGRARGQGCLSCDHRFFDTTQVAAFEYAVFNTNYF